MLLRPRNQARGNPSASSSAGEEAGQQGDLPTEYQPSIQHRAARWVAGATLSLLLLLVLAAVRGWPTQQMPSPDLAARGRLASSRRLDAPGGVLPPDALHLASIHPELSPVAAQYPDIAKACSAEFRSRNAEAVQQGQPPLIVQWGCDVQACLGQPVQRMLDSYRQRQQRDFLEFVPCDLFSQQQYFYRQLRCFLGPFLEKAEAPRRDARLTEDPRQLAAIEQRLLRGYCCGVEVPICTHLVGGTRVCHVRVNKAFHLLDDYLPNLDLLNVSLSDYLVLNVGLWHHFKEGDYPGLMQRLADYYAANRTQLPIMIWRDNSPQHFDIANGEFPHPTEAEEKLGPGPKKCAPMKDVLLLNDGTLWGKNAHVKRGGWRNNITEPLMRAAGIHYLATWNETITLFDMHTAGECTHFCSPGGYNIWVWQLWRLLRGLQQEPHTS